MAVVYRQPQKSPWETLEELTPQWIQMLTDWKKIDAATELKQQEAQATAQYRKDTLDENRKDRESRDFNTRLKLFDDPESRLTFLKGQHGSSTLGGIDLSPLISVTEDEIKSNQKGEIFLNDFRFGKVSDLDVAWGSYYGLDPNDKEDLKWFNQAKDIQTRRESTVKNTYSKISSLASLVTALKDPSGKIPTDLQDMGVDLREQLLDLYQSGGPVKPLMIGGKKIVLPSNIEVLSTQEIMDTIASQVRSEEMEEGYAELLSGIGLPLDEPDMVADEPLTDLLLKEFAPWEAPPVPSTDIGGVPTRPSIPTRPDRAPMMANVPVPAMPDIQELIPWIAPPIPDVSMNIIKSGIGSSVVEINGVQKNVSPTELSVLQKGGKRWNQLSEKRREYITGKIAKKFNTTKEAIDSIPPSIVEAPTDLKTKLLNLYKYGETVESTKVDNFIMIDEGMLKSKIELNGIQANVSHSELAILRGEDRFGMNQRTKSRFISSLAKRFNVTEEDIKKLPFEKYKR
jgi:hypothetical protein